MADISTHVHNWDSNYPKVREPLSTAGFEPDLAVFTENCTLGTESGFQRAIDWIDARGYTVTTSDVPAGVRPAFVAYVKRRCTIANGAPKAEYAGIFLATDGAWFS